MPSGTSSSNGESTSDITVLDIVTFLMHASKASKAILKNRNSISELCLAIASGCQLHNLDIGSFKPLDRLLRSVQIQDLTVPAMFSVVGPEYSS